MSDLQVALAVVLSLFGLAAIGGGLFAWAKSTAQGARIDRLQDERDDYLSRLNFIEPRYAALEEQNKTLRTLTDPTARLVDLGTVIETNSQQILSVLNRQSATLQEIKNRVHVDPRTGRETP